MNEAELLRREIRATRQELVRKRSQRLDRGMNMEARLPLLHRHNDAFLRLALLSADELQVHLTRLKRDLADLER